MYLIRVYIPRGTLQIVSISLFLLVLWTNAMAELELGCFLCFQSGASRNSQKLTCNSVCAVLRFVTVGHRG